MRVLHVITRLIIGGAQENTLWNVFDQVHIHGDCVRLVTGPATGPEGSLENWAAERALDVELIPELQRSISPLRDLAAGQAIRDAIRKFRPDIVHTHSSKAGILGRRAAFRLGVPAVHTIHGASFHYGQSAPAFAAYRWLERRAAAWCDHFISVCDAMTRQYVEAGIASADRFTTIYSGMDTEQFLRSQRDPAEVRRELNLQPDDIVIGKVGRLFDLKGHDHVISAASAVAAALPRVRFLFVGDGILRGRFESRIRDLGLTEHFRFAGLVSPDRIPDYLHAMDVVVHASDWEGLPRVLPQALLAGCPVISFDNDGAPEVCIPGETGILVPYRNVELLARAMIELGSRPDLRKQLAERGRLRCREVFSHEFMTRRVRAVYEQVLGQRDRQHPAP